jgi:phosphoribosylformimino-5-aminoimidazole carboxamide ribotide isomerase
MIVLDLAQVGMGQGVGTLPLCRELRCLDADLQIIGGGGVRSLADLRSLSAAGASAALVASALHDGRLMPAECLGLR